MKNIHQHVVVYFVQLSAPSKTSFLFKKGRLVLVLIMLFFIQTISYSLPIRPNVRDTDTTKKNVKNSNSKTYSSILGNSPSNSKADTITALKKEVVALRNEIATGQQVSNQKTSIGVVVAIGIICLAVCGFLIYTANNSPKDEKAALGLPDGSVRAIIAVLIIMFYVLVSIALALSGDYSPSSLATDVTKTLGTLAVAVSAFYFGSKASEQGSQIATNAFTAGHLAGVSAIAAAGQADAAKGQQEGG